MIVNPLVILVAQRHEKAGVTKQLIRSAFGVVNLGGFPFQAHFANLMLGQIFRLHLGVLRVLRPALVGDGLDPTGSLQGRFPLELATFHFFLRLASEPFLAFSIAAAIFFGVRDEPMTVAACFRIALSIPLRFSSIWLVSCFGRKLF